MKLQQRTGQIEICQTHVTQMVTTCNQLILDFCNTLWRAQAFTTPDKTSVFYFNPAAVDKTLEGENMAGCLSLYRHFAFLTFAVKFIEKVCYIWKAVTRKAVVGVCDQLRLKQACSADETSWGIEISAIASRGVILSRQQTTTADVHADLPLCRYHMA